MNEIYQIISFVNAYNKRTKRWESLYSVTKVYVGIIGLKTAHIEFLNQTNEVQFYLQQNRNKYSDVRGKVEVQIANINNNGSLAYWSDNVLYSYNPLNI